MPTGHPCLPCRDVENPLISGSVRQKVDVQATGVFSDTVLWVNSRTVGATVLQPVSAFNFSFCVNKSHSVSPGCMFAMVLALEEDAVIHNFVAEPGADALKVDGSPNPFKGHILGGEEVRDRRKGLLNDFRWKGSIRTIVNRGLASNRLCLLLLKARSTNAEASRQVILTF